ncbi:tripartite motif-containing protein 2-like [Haliotis asinina]|uniref:tripartite motif-containing protein 2-like n=1 Tax=Haliotis asinina TaxID=109174 RepID=UPI003531DDA0
MSCVSLIIVRAMYVLKRLFRTEQASTKAELDQSKLVRKVGRKGKGKGNFNMPCGVAVTKAGDIVVADTENHRIQIFSPEGVFKFKFGVKGSKPEQMNYPMCIAMTTDECIALTDSVNACVKVFSVTGVFKEKFGGNDVFEFPYGIAISPDNYVVVTDICKHSVVVLYPSGGVSHTFGCYGDDVREFDHPYFVAVNKNKQIIVSDAGNSAIKIFHFEGKLLRTFSLNEFRLPAEETFVSLQGLCTDTDGNTIVICNSTVYILTKNGRLWEIFTPKDGLSSPKCVTFSPLGRVVVTQSNFDDRHEMCIYRYNVEDYKPLNTLVYYAISI